MDFSDTALFCARHAAVSQDAYSASQYVEHDDVSFLLLGRTDRRHHKLVGEIRASYLREDFSTEEHFRRRVAKLGEMERAAASEMGGDGAG